MNLPFSEFFFNGSFVATDNAPFEVHKREEIINEIGCFRFLHVYNGKIRSTMQDPKPILNVPVGIVT